MRGMLKKLSIIILLCSVLVGQLHAEFSIYQLYWSAQVGVPASCRAMHDVYSPGLGIAASGMQIHKLSHGQWLYEFECEIYAYQGGYRFVLFDGDVKWHRQLQFAKGYRGDNGQWHVERHAVLSGFPEVSAQKRTIYTFHKSRGPGDCGTIQYYAILPDARTKLRKLQYRACDDAPRGDFLNTEAWPVIELSPAQRLAEPS